jgi:hypothetical protein
MDVSQKMRLAALPGYLSNYVPCPGSRFSADFGGYPGFAFQRLGRGTTQDGALLALAWNRPIRRQASLPPEAAVVEFANDTFTGGWSCSVDIHRNALTCIKSV